MPTVKPDAPITALRDHVSENARERLIIRSRRIADTLARMSDSVERRAKRLAESDRRSPDSQEEGAFVYDLIADLQRGFGALDFPGLVSGLTDYQEALRTIPVPSPENTDAHA